LSSDGHSSTVLRVGDCESWNTGMWNGMWNGTQNGTQNGTWNGNNAQEIRNKK